MDQTTFADNGEWVTIWVVGGPCIAAIADYIKMFVLISLERGIVISCDHIIVCLYSPFTPREKVE